MRREIERKLGIDAIDIYGLSEVMGPGVANECIETKDGPVIWEDHFYPEIIDPETGEVLPDGEEGELVFTSLTKEAFPVIRYRTRDLTRLLPPTARSFRRMGKITGPLDDMLIIRGVNVFPTQIEEQILRDKRLSGNYQIVLTATATWTTSRSAAKCSASSPASCRQPTSRRSARNCSTTSRPLRRHPHPHRPLRRRAGRRARRRPRRHAAQGADGAQPAGRLGRVEDIIYGCANQAGEDNRNVARMAGLLAGLPVEVPGTTVNRLCGSGMDAVGLAARSIKSGETELMIAGGVESMSRAPFVMGKAESAFSRSGDLRHHHRLALHQPADEEALRHALDAADGRQRRRRIQHRPRRPGCLCAALAAALGRRPRRRPLQGRARAGEIPRKKGDPLVVDTDEHPRPDTTLEMLAKLKGVNGPELTSPPATPRASMTAPVRCCWPPKPLPCQAHGLTPRARVVAMATAGVAPRIMGFGPAPAVRKVLAKPA
jgi:acetyl-CoA acetyltransferase